MVQQKRVVLQLHKEKCTVSVSALLLLHNQYCSPRSVCADRCCCHVFISPRLPHGPSLEGEQRLQGNQPYF